MMMPNLLLKKLAKQNLFRVISVFVIFKNYWLTVSNSSSIIVVV